MIKNIQKAVLSRITDKHARREALSFVVAFALIAGLVSLQSKIAPSVYTWLATLPPLVVIFITAVARINDINKSDWVSQFRRLGMAICAVGGAMWALIPLVPSENYPSWKAVVILWGWAITWFTTPNVGPWWKYINGETKLKKNQGV